MALTANCPIHPNEIMTEKQGQYGPFFSHKTDDGWCNGKVKGENSYSRPSYQAAKPQGNTRDFESTLTEKRSSTDVLMEDRYGSTKDPEARGKTRCQVMCAAIQREGLAEALSAIDSIEKAVDYVMNGPSK